MPPSEIKEQLQAALHEAYRSKRPPAERIARAEALKRHVGHDHFTAALSEALPELRDPTAWLGAQRARERKRSEREHQRREAQASPLGADEIAIYEELKAAQRMSRRAREMTLDALADSTGKAKRTLKRLLAKMTSGGAKALRHEPRKDKGEIRLPDEVKQAFIARRRDVNTRHERVSVSADRIRAQFPGSEIPYRTLLRLDHRIPAVARMSNREWDARFKPGGPVEVPHPNHTHAFDFTTSDVFVWDRDPDEKPYRPHLSAIVDEHTHSCMFALYTKDTPSVAALQAVILHAWLPKDPKLEWIQYGPPLHLHCDNGKVQTSKWLDAVCRTLKTDFDLTHSIRHTAVHEPWQNGHIERFFGIVHERYETMFGPAYCGKDVLSKPDCFRDPSSGGPRLWGKYPTLEEINSGIRGWVRGEFHTMYHRRLKMTRNEAWQHFAPPYVRSIDADYLYGALLQRDRRQVTRGRIQLNGQLYWHERLQGYDLTPLDVRWDPADLDRLMVLDYEGRLLCWAEREKHSNVESPADFAELKAIRRRKKEGRRAIERAIQEVAPTDQRTYRRTLERMAQARQQAGIFDFPGGRREPEKPEQPDELTADEILSILPESMPEPKKITLYGLEL